MSKGNPHEHRELWTATHPSVMFISCGTKVVPIFRKIEGDRDNLVRFNMK